MNEALVIPAETQQGGHTGLAVTLFSLGLGTLLEHGLDQLAPTIMALAAFVGAAAAALPALTHFLDKRQVRRHAEERHKSRREL